jgi:hypothetical protein
MCWKWHPWVSIQAWTHLILFANTFCRSAFRKLLCTYKMCWKWHPRVSIQAWTHLIWFANTFCRSVFRKSLCTYKMCWKWQPWVSIQAWTHLILSMNTFCRSAFRKSLCTYKMCWKWCPQVPIQAWTKSMWRSLSAQRLSECTVCCWQLLHPCNISKMFLTALKSFLWHFSTTSGTPAIVLKYVWQL